MKESPAIGAVRQRLTSRDKELIHKVWAYRVLDTKCIASLLFPTASVNTVSSQCLARLRFLTRAGYLERREQLQVMSEGRKPYLYYLGEKGARFIADLTGTTLEDLDWSSAESDHGYLFLNHLLDTNRFRVAITLAAERQGGHLVDWVDDRSLKQERRMYVEVSRPESTKTERIAVVPDGAFSLNVGEYWYHFFLELDRGTVVGASKSTPTRDWFSKVRVYLKYFELGYPQAKFKSDSIRVLTVTTSATRLANLKRITETAEGQHRFWFGLLSELNPDNVLTTPVWHVATKDEPLSLLW